MSIPRHPRSISVLLLACVVGALPVGAAAQGLTQSPTAVVPADPQRNSYWLTLERGENGLRMTGLVLDSLTKTVLTTYAAALYGAARVDASLTEIEAGKPMPPDWVQMAMAALDTLAELDAGKAELTEGAVRVAGGVAEPEDAGALTRALREKLPPGVRVSTEFAVEPPDVVAAITLSAERCAYLMTRVAAERQILFASGSAEIEDDSLPGLETIASLFDRCPEAEIEVAGYTDSRGEEEANLDLSQARAEAVMEALQGKGIPLRRLRARGFGEADPIASNETEAGRARNRRIEFKAVE